MSYYKNRKGTSDRGCNCGSWKQHWINFSRRMWPSSCQVSTCVGSAEVGAHVIRVRGAGEEFIAPLCRSCNNRNGDFWVNDDMVISANRANTCGY